MASATEELTATEPEVTQTPVEGEKDAEALTEEYKVKADELENRIDRLEGRQSREQQLSNWFVEQDSDVNVQPLVKKGMASYTMIDPDFRYERD